MPNMDEATITGISSMATRLLLAELAAAWEQRSGTAVAIESVGGVDAAKRVQAGEVFDLVVLASDAIERLLASGHVAAGSRIDLVRSDVAVAVKAGTARPDIGSEDALRRALLGARSLAYSTGPSGVALAQLFERWGIADELRPRIVQPPPGVPVATLVARGEVELGFQQLSELIHVQGIELLGPLPDAVRITTIFSGGVCTASSRPEAARAVLEFMASPDAAEAKRRQGMAPA